MKLRIIAALAAVLFAAAILLFAPKGSALTRNTVENCGEICSVYYGKDERFYILGKLNDNYVVTALDNAGNSFRKIIDVDSNVTPYAYFNDMFCFFTEGTEISNGDPMSFVTVVSYNCISGTVLTRTINNADIVQKGKFAFDGERYYLPEHTILNIYNSKYKFENSVSLDDQYLCMEVSPDGSCVYCICQDSVVMIDGSAVYDISIKTDNIYTFGDKFSDSNSVVYSRSGESILFDEFEPSHGVGEIGGWLIGVKDNTVCAVNNDSTVKLCSAKNDMFISGSGCVICVSRDGDNAETTVITQEDIISALSALDNNNIGSAADKNEIPYDLDKMQRVVRNIAPGTTAAEVKRITGGTVTDKNGNAASGKMATGMHLLLEDKSFDVIIGGDLNGTGTVNTTDMELICDHICGKGRLDGVYYQAADLNMDNVIDVKDAYILNRMLN